MRLQKFLFVIAFLLCSMSGIAKKVQFRVDMTGNVLSAQGIHVFGDFQAVAGFGLDWTPGSCTMTKDAVDTNIYFFNVDIPAFAKYEYKYINGDQSYEVEIVPAETQVGYNFVDNRWIYIDSLNSDTMKLAPVQFNKNAPAGLFSVRFVVDMSLQTIPSNGAHIAGSHQGNDPSTDRLYSFAYNHYEIISYLNAGTYSYKFYNGNTLATTETVPSACATAGNRTCTISGDVILNTYCFSSCAPNCYPTFVTSTENANAITIYPNPSNGNFVVQSSATNKLSAMQVMDMQGRICRQNENIHNNHVAIENLPSGIYVVTSQLENGESNRTKILID
jgi:alpha-amylase